MKRRDFLNTCGAVSLGFLGLHGLMGRTANASPTPSQIVEGFGRILPDPHGILDLPEGFTYRVISRSGNVMSDGFIVPAGPDGMATFAGPNGRTILIRNHELNPAPDSQGAFGDTQELFSKVPAGKAYDAGHGKHPALGGTTTILFNTQTGTVEKEWLSLAGTLRNCAGGPTPWNSWITCEETDVRANEKCEHDHGYNFEVPATAEPALADPVPLKDMGRFRHEAIAVDPNSGIIYETEDTGDSCIYRFIPKVAGKPAEGGKLQALAVVDRDTLDTRNWEGSNEVKRGEQMAVRWVDLENVEAPDNDLRMQAQSKGAAMFARGEGMWAGNGAIYFACTNGGNAEKGQIFSYTPSPVEGKPEESGQPGTLELFVEPNDGGLIENADNLTVAPWGDLIVCEDGSGDDFLVGVTPEGNIYKFAHNALSDAEFAGATFSPDGTTLFVNIQGGGLTLAITGPWQQRTA